MVAHVTYGGGRARARAARGGALELLTHLRRAAIVVGLAFVSAAGKRRAKVPGQAGAHRHVVDHLALGVLAARAGVTLGLCEIRGTKIKTFYGRVGILRESKPSCMGVQ